MTEHNYEPIIYPVTPENTYYQKTGRSPLEIIGIIIAITSGITIGIFSLLMLIPGFFVWLVMAIALGGNGGTDRQPEHTEQTSITASWNQQTLTNANKTHFTIRK